MSPEEAESLRGLFDEAHSLIRDSPDALRAVDHSFDGWLRTPNLLLDRKFPQDSSLEEVRQILTDVRNVYLLRAIHES